MTDDLYRTRLTEAMKPFAREHPTVWGRADDGPFDADALRDHDQRGFTILPDFIAPEEVKTYQAELNRLTSDPSLRREERVVSREAVAEVLSRCAAAKICERIDQLAREPPLLERAEQLLGCEVYPHQTASTYIPGFEGSGFYWLADFETWYAEDGMPAPRA